MPYKIVKTKKGYFVEDKKGKKLSKDGLTKTKAERQRIAIAISESNRNHKDPSYYFA